jgi:TolB-like protein
MSRTAVTHISISLGRVLLRSARALLSRPASPSRSSLRDASFALAAVLSLLPISLCGADGLEHRQATVLVVVYSSGQSDNKALSALIADSFTMELESQGIRTLSAAEQAGDDRAVAALAVKNRADFALCGTYVQKGSEVQLNARWIDAETMTAAGHASRTGALDLSFDSVVTSLVDEIVESQKQRIENLPLAPVDRTPAPARPGQKPAEPDRGSRIPPFAFTLGSAPFIATFTALNYFPVGLTVTLAGHYQMQALGGLLGFGLTSGLSGFHGKGSYAQADFYVIPIGIEILYGTRTGSAIDFFTHVAGGPAVFAAKLTSGESLAKVIPFVTGGVGITLSLFDSLGISVEAGYACYFDSPDPIMGFTPALSVVLRL